MKTKHLRYENAEDGILEAQAAAADESIKWSERRAIVDSMYEMVSSYNSWAAARIKDAEGRVGRCPCCPLEASICWMNPFREEGTAGRVDAAPCKLKMEAFFDAVQRPELEERFRKAAEGKCRLTMEDLSVATGFLENVMDAGGWLRWQNNQSKKEEGTIEN